MTVQHGRSRVKKADLPLQITSMMDMFTIILVFLLKSFSADGSILTNADNLVLPNSDSKKKPQEITLQLAVTNEMIMIDNVPVVPTDDVRRIAPTVENPVIPQIEERLRGCLALEEEMVRMGSLSEVRRKIIIQVDKNADFDVLYKVMNSCGKAGYTNMNFAVMEREG